ncbi:MAG: hypothetical protein WDO16_13195 [Bacteroidota bacterium]
MTNAQAASFQADGFEIALHPTTNCTNFTQSSITSSITSQLGIFSSNFPDILPPVTNRTHCMPWSDWASHAKAEAAKGMRMDANYYYWPGAWVQNRPGVFTGSGFPMRFADLDGTMIDCYQLTTQMTDESEIGIADFTDALLDKALGAEGYYGTFNANMHTDTADHTGSNAVIASQWQEAYPLSLPNKCLPGWMDVIILPLLI